MAPLGGREWSRAHKSRSLSLLAAPGLALHKPRRPGGLRPSHSLEQGATAHSSGGVQAVPSTQLRPEPGRLSRRLEGLVLHHPAHSGGRGTQTGTCRTQGGSASPSGAPNADVDKESGR